MHTEETIEKERRQSDLYEELREMEERKKEIYKEVGLPYYNLEVSDVLNFAKGELTFVDADIHNSFGLGQELGLESVIEYIESYKKGTKK